ncbi:MAG: glutathione S-transferase N-terminal domain-containing protein [Actinomycetota bacterium]|nr:glutathione S-transferase N-terminal domain-containing protein [Actinomycetota bacterium]
MSRPTLYVIPGSHPAMAARRMLEHKGIEYRRIDLMPVVSRGVLKVLRFPGITIPSLRIDGQRVTGSREIPKALDQLKPNPPLYPADPADRVQVEDAERWGDEVLQDAVRRILWNAIKRDRKPLRTFLDGARIGVPHGLAVATAAPIIAAELRINDVTDAAVEADLAAFPGWLDRIDGWIEGGVLGGAPNAADFQIASGLRLAMTLDDLRPAIEGRPAGQLSKRLVPDFPGRVPPALPSEWLDPLRGSSGAGVPA